jgi:elongation factor Ts
MQITPDMVRELREKTGAGMMDCKKALTEAGGEMEAAFDVLRKRGLAAAAKKAFRIASEGAVAARAGERSAALVEVNCETDFVAKTPEFREFVREVAALVDAEGPADVEEALRLPLAGGGTLAEALTERIARIGEKISFRRFSRFLLPAGETGVVASYIHAGGRIGVLVELLGRGGEDPEFAALGKDLAMQVAAANPSYIARQDVPEEAVAREKAIYREQALAAGKPEKILDRIAEGKLEKFYGDVCLVEQPFIRDPDRKVGSLIKEMAAKAGRDVRVGRFVRFQVGEGLERRSHDLAADVAGQLGKA